jgi:hypothetical protein
VVAFARIGSVEMSDVILAGDVRVRPPGVHEVDILLSRGFLREHPVEYAATASIHIDDRGTPESGFSGFVNRVHITDEVLRVTLVSGLVEVGERQIGGIQFHGTQPLEKVWSLIRMAGIDEDRINIYGFRKGPVETFRVAVPLHGLMVEPDLTLAVGEVLVTSSPEVRQWADSYDYGDLVERYRSGPLWAYTDVHAGTAFDAEAEAMRRIARAVEWLTLRMNYSYSIAPNGSPFVYERSYQQADYDVGSPTLVGGQATGRGWIRNPEDPIERPTIAYDEARSGQLPGVVPALPSNLREAIGFWRQAKRAESPIDAIVLLTTAMEFYAAGLKPARHFTRRDRRGIERRINVELTPAIEGCLQGAEERCLREAFEAVSEGMREELRARLNHSVRRLLDDLNDTPFPVRLREAANRDGVPISGEEWDMLDNVRSMRNRLVHGEDVPEPDPALLRYALALVNRMVMHRVARLATPDPSAVRRST